MSDSFAERSLIANGMPIRCLERGNGETVVVLHGESDFAPSPLEHLLAQRFRVLALDFARHASQDGARRVAGAVAALGLGKFALIADGPAATAALAQVADATTPPDTLVLLSPAGPLPGAAARLHDIKTPTLILTGTKDTPATDAFSRICTESIPESYAMLVYDSGSAMATERPAALFEAIADFLERRGRFILERQESVISP